MDDLPDINSLTDEQMAVLNGAKHAYCQLRLRRAENPKNVAREIRLLLEEAKIDPRFLSPSLTSTTEEVVACLADFESGKRSNEPARGR